MTMCVWTWEEAGNAWQCPGGMHLLCFMAYHSRAVGTAVPLPVWHSDASTSLLGNLGRAVETASPKVVIPIISSGITIQACYPHATLKQRFVIFFFMKWNYQYPELSLLQLCSRYVEILLKFILTICYKVI